MAEGSLWHDGFLVGREPGQRASGVDQLTGLEERVIDLHDPRPDHRMGSAVRPTHPTVSVVIPALNEADDVGEVLSRLPECVDEVLLVDGMSTDDTVEAARAACPWVKVLELEPTGKGAARGGLRCGNLRHRGDARCRRVHRSW